MKILHYIDRFDFGLGGVVQYVFQLCQKLAAEGKDVSLITGDAKDVPPSWLDRSIENTPNAYVLSRPPKRIQSWLDHQQLDELTEVARRHDVVHLHGAWDFGNLRLSKRLRDLNIPVVVSPHGMLDDWSLAEKRWKKQLFLSLFVRNYFRTATLVHCTAQAEIDQVNSNVPGIGEFFCVPPFVTPIDLTQADAELAFQAFPEISREIPKLLFLSRLHPKKGPEFLLDAAAELKRRSIQVQVIMAGPGDEAYVSELKTRSQALSIADDIVWTGLVKDPIKTSLYLAADVFVLATHQENFGIVLAESMLAGLPVVTTRGTDIHKELERFGAIISETSGTAIAESLQCLLNDPADRQRRSELGRQGVADWLSAENVLNGHLEMYQKAMQRVD